jgi:hypothetical protein
VSGVALRPGRFTPLVEGWGPSSDVRREQIARLESLLHRTQLELAGGGELQLALFRRPRFDATTRRAQEWLDRILIPEEPKNLWFLVRIVSIESGAREGIWYGFKPDTLMGGVTLRLGDEDGSLGSTLHIAPGNLVRVEALECRVFPEDEW